MIGCSKSEQTDSENVKVVSPGKDVIDQEKGQPLDVGVALAKRSYELANRLGPIVYTGNGVIGMDQLVYGRTVDLPASDLLAEWPVGGGIEDQTWGDNLYCKDALLVLNLNAMAEFNRSKLPSSSDVERFNKSLETCKAVLSKK